MQKCWHYLYVIVYPSLDYRFYYGSRITKNHPDADHSYFGSSVTFAHYNDPNHPEYQSDAVKVILTAQYRLQSRKAAKELSDAESELIKAAHANTEHLGPDVCLNRNAAGRFLLTEEQRKLALERSFNNGSGFTNMDPKTRKKWASIGGARSVELRTGLHAIPEDRMREFRARGNQTIIEKYAKTYNFRNPAGEPVVVHNLNAFCRQNGLRASHMRSVIAGRLKTHQGWQKG